MPKVVFVATDQAHGTELWVTDGTAAGTYLLRESYPGPSSGLPSIASNVVGLGNGKALFEAKTGGGAYPAFGVELWVTNGTTGTPKPPYRISNNGNYSDGTSLVKDINLAGSSYPSYITALGNGQAVFRTHIGGTYGL